ncbi:MAG: UDP-N-acetylmuramoyl-L-alanyl-D-glutamate--2,6-diaminopimelate ligase [Acidimicrobiia bacterium]|nr:UDP-N-acetylmuramoyl-L-alanyl-D-glutamate--2,6-diaminopimelate ligase [Acidimicrobiia bacterium]
MPDRPFTLACLAGRLGGEMRGDGSILIEDVTHDSRQVAPGFLFVAVPGRIVDGHRFLEDAARRGAAAALVQDRFSQVAIPQIRVPDTRRVLGVAASMVHGEPSRGLEVIGVTGTNGKTTVTVMLEAIARAAGRSCGKIGTLGVTLDGVDEVLSHTTPEGADLQRLLRRMVDRGVSMVAMEVSSHALALSRVEGVSFSVAAFTNLSQDHLDFHGNMEDYYLAKASLFDGRAAVHVIDVTTAAGRRLARSATGPVVTVGRGPGHDVSIVSPDPDLSQARFRCRIGGQDVALDVRPGGLHNIHNAAVAAACAQQVGIGSGAIRAGLGAMVGVRGRLDPVDLGQPFQVLIDYAHSPEAVESVVRTARAHSRGSVIVVVGGAGDRDATKRPLLGAAAARADLAVITSDNPRSEDPALLVEQVVAGTRDGRARVLAEVERDAAIRLAIEHASPGDVVLILGKGHETYQDFGTRVVPFDDREVAASWLAARPGQ